MGNLIINLDSLASGRLDITTGAFDYNTTLNLDPLASGRLDGNSNIELHGGCNLDPLASGRLDLEHSKIDEYIDI